MRRSCFGLLYTLLLLSLPLVGAPQLQPGAIVNGASFTVYGAPNAGIAQGSLFTVFGVDTGPSSPMKATEFPLPFRLGGVMVKVTAGGRQFDCPLIYVSNTQVTGILPSDAPVGPASVVLIYETASSKPVDFQVVARTFGIFSRNATGSGLSVLQNYTTPAIQPANGLGDAAVPGQIGILWGTGLGASLNADDRNPPAPGNLLPISNLKVNVGGKDATVLYAGRSGCCSGVDQINFVVPAGVAGCFVPVYVTVGGVPSNFTTMSIAAAPGACEGAFGLTGDALEPLLTKNTVRTGLVSLQRTTVNNPFFTFNTDSGFARFTEFTAEGFQTAGQNLVDGALFPGTCVVRSFRHDALVTEGRPVPPDLLNPFRVRGLNAGAVLTVSSILGNRLIGLVPGSGGTYQGTLSSAANPLQAFLLPGRYTIGNGAAGNEVGAFNFSRNVPGFELWSNRTAISTINRSQGFTVTWEPGLNPNGVVAITAYSLSVPKKVASSLVCHAPNAPGSFTVPPSVLAAMVESDGGVLADVLPTGSLGVGGVAAPVTFQAPGIDLGIFSSTALESKDVKFQ
jgi:uncharacterized protein (TIGR03437 family)